MLHPQKRSLDLFYLQHHWAMQQTSLIRESDEYMDISENKIVVTQFRNKGKHTYVVGMEYSMLKLISKQQYGDLNNILHLTLRVHTSMIRTFKQHT